MASAKDQDQGQHRLDGFEGCLGTPDDAWAAQVELFLKAKRTSSSVGDDWIRRMRWELLRVPRLQSQLDATRVTTAKELDETYLQTIRERTGWEKATIALHFAAVRQFMKWAQNPVADESRFWTLPSGVPSKRRWLTKEHLLQLYSKSRGSARLLIALEAFNGLRRVEVLRLRVQDVLLQEGCIRVLGKGRNGGKWRKIPIHSIVAELLAREIGSKSPAVPVLPTSRSGADLLLQTAARDAGLGQAGIRVSHHDLRRTFGRLSHEAGMDLVQLKNLFGHSSIEMTVHYIGFDADEMRTGLAKLSRFLGIGADVPTGHYLATSN